jgi:general secretion pathway protein I
LRQGGFTLIEVLVAFVILVAALPVLYAIFTSGLRGTALADDYQRAAAFGESWLARAGIVEPLRENDRTSVEEGRYTLTYTARPYRPWRDVDEEQLAVRAYRVNLDVGWEQHGRRRSVSLSTIKLAPIPKVAGR